VAEYASKAASFFGHVLLERLRGVEGRIAAAGVEDHERRQPVGVTRAHVTADVAPP
jgi:hypothetical protein